MSVIKEQYIDSCLEYYGIIPGSDLYNNVFSLMNWCFRDTKNFLPIQMCFYFTINENYKDGINLEWNNKILPIASKSFDDLLCITQELIKENPNFIGWITENNFSVQGYIDFVKKLYPNKQIYFCWPDTKENGFTGYSTIYKIPNEDGNDLLQKP